MPDDIVTALVGRVWPRVVRAAAALDDLGSTKRRPSPGTFLTRQTRMSLPRNAMWATRRITDRRAEHRISRMLRDGFDPHHCTPDELARNQADREAFFALVAAWRSELS